MILALLALAAAQPEPTDHTLIYYNARLALREGSPTEAVKLWLLRNALEEVTGAVSVHDPDFRSVTWAALGELGLCMDGFPRDSQGAGLWPVALHNWVIRNMGRKNISAQPRPFDAFEVDRQQRFVAIGDVLSFQELRTLRLSRGRCFRQRTALVAAGELPTADLSDRAVAARLLLHLLHQARLTLAHDRVRGEAAIEARLFDINLQLAALAAREARQKASQQATLGRLLGLSRESTQVMRQDAPKTTLDPSSEAGRILRASVRWSVSEWMSLSPDRRLFIFDHAMVAQGGSSPALDAAALGIIDRLIAAGEGAEVQRWIAHRDARTDGTSQAAIWDGERGAALLALDREAGFTERSVIALHRGVRQLEQGALPDALRSMAFAMQHASESRVSEEVTALSRRWMSYVAGQFEITDALLAMLRELVPRREYAMILEDLMWRAAFHADLASFERGIEGQQGRGALSRRVELLYPLARGDLGRFTRDMRDGLDASPSETLRLIDQLVQRLELEEAGIRAAHLPTLARLRALLVPLADGDGGRTTRLAGELLARMQAIMEGLEGLGVDASERDRARALSPSGEVFAGSVRLAPADALPWPFWAAEIPAPSIFSPLTLTPREWRDADGEQVFGWSIDG